MYHMAYRWYTSNKSGQGKPHTIFEKRVEVITEGR
jgi:hypothetical protein